MQQQGASTSGPSSTPKETAVVQSLKSNNVVSAEDEEEDEEDVATTPEDVTLETSPLSPELSAEGDVLDDLPQSLESVQSAEANQKSSEMLV